MDEGSNKSRMVIGVATSPFFNKGLGIMDDGAGVETFGNNVAILCFTLAELRGAFDDF